MATLPEPGAGDIPITLDGKDLVLVPTAQACLGISNLAGGLSAAVDRCMRMDFSTIVEVVAFGLNVNPNQKKALVDAVFRAGLINISADCILFIRTVANGGKRPVEAGEGEGDGDDADRPLDVQSQSENTTSA